MTRARNSALVSRVYTLVCLLLLSCSAVAEAPMFDAIEVEVNQERYQLEYATTGAQRARGLMHRDSLCADCGMLFNFGHARAVGMWMKNTLIPLDVAFIRANGEVANIEAMQPNDLNTTYSNGEVLYAWEMNQGWFAKHKIKVGDKVTIAKK